MEGGTGASKAWEQGRNEEVKEKMKVKIKKRRDTSIPFHRQKSIPQYKQAHGDCPH